MFEVEKPRKFHYVPRFYDPEKERWEALKKKYAIEREAEAAKEGATEPDEKRAEGEADLEYFERRVRSIDRRERAAASHLTWRDMFRKREMPRFHDQPRFGAAAMQEHSDHSEGEGKQEGEAIVEKYRLPLHRIQIRRRFDISDPDYM